MDESFTIRSITFHAECRCTFTLGLKWQILGLSLLTASVRGELPEVQVFHWEVDKSGQFAGSDAGFREALQIWTSEAVKEKTLSTRLTSERPVTSHFNLTHQHIPAHTNSVLILSVITVNKHTDAPSDITKRSDGIRKGYEELVF